MSTASARAGWTNWGQNKAMPVSGASSLAGSMSIAGIPPFNGFWSKLIIILFILVTSFTAAHRKGVKRWEKSVVDRYTEDRASGDVPKEGAP